MFAANFAFAAVSTGGCIGWALLALLLGLILGAQITTHEEHTLNYNLEDEELDLLHNIEARLIGDERAVLSKVRAIFSQAKADVKKAL